MRQILLLLLISLLTACSSQQQGGAQNVLVAAGSAAEFSLSPASLNRMVAAAQSQFNQQGHKAFDITAVSGLSRYEQGSLEHRQLLDIAKSASRPVLDVLVYLQVDVNVRDTGYSRKVVASVDGSMLRVGSGKVLASRSMRHEHTVSASCSASCMHQEVGDVLRQLAQDLAAVLATQLGAASNSNPVAGNSAAYNLTFNNFNASQLADIEQALSAIQGYRNHRPGYLGHTRAEYWYETKLGSAALNREVQLMLKQLGLRATIQFSGNSLMIEHISLRKAQPSADYQW